MREISTLQGFRATGPDAPSFGQGAFIEPEQVDAAKQGMAAKIWGQLNDTGVIRDMAVARASALRLEFEDRKAAGDNFNEFVSGEAPSYEELITKARRALKEEVDSEVFAYLEDKYADRRNLTDRGLRFIGRTVKSAPGAALDATIGGLTKAEEFVTREGAGPPASVAGHFPGTSGQTIGGIGKKIKSRLVGGTIKGEAFDLLGIPQITGRALPKGPPIRFRDNEGNIRKVIRREVPLAIDRGWEQLDEL